MAFFPFKFHVHVNDLLISSKRVVHLCRGFNCDYFDTE